MTLATDGVPIALTIAGSDSGGGAGIQADLKTFAALGVFGTSAVTAITAQNPEGVSAIQAIEPAVVAAQISAVMAYFPVGAAKTGMLFSTAIIGAVADALTALARPAPAGTPLRERLPPLVVDPVMVATSGAKLLNDDAIGALCERMLPLGALVTPNMAEAELLAGRPVRVLADLEPAAREIARRFGVPALVKGGHLEGSREAVDVLWDGRRLHTFSRPFIQGVNAHGTGCTLSAAIAAFLALGRPLPEAVAEGKAFLHGALSGSLRAGRGLALNHGFAPRPLGVPR
ncbi:MAG: bifunctional hydroxymethylpyrimidine kinase/phosphomethylpyrimidine kinase [Candidatus Lambdaproteobacteria bacterium]|nr:bifunctional hydroxymethylpyrimidine kinase/phosphomethylpyrimidine kinase [Candidatus Lambdaproteobacteria bacterium]